MVDALPVGGKVATINCPYGFMSRSIRYSLGFYNGIQRFLPPLRPVKTGQAVYITPESVPTYSVGDFIGRCMPVVTFSGRLAQYFTLLSVSGTVKTALNVTLSVSGTGNNGPYIPYNIRFVYYIG